MSTLHWLATPLPDAALALGPDAVVMAALDGRSSDPVVQAHVVAPLPAGALVPSLTAHNMADRGAVVAALRAAVEGLGRRTKRVALLLPDLAAKVTLVRFEQVPAGRRDLDQLIRWQVRKAAPFPIDDAQVSYTPGVPVGEGREFVVVLARHEIVREYESVCEEVGLYPGLVDLSTFGLINLLLGGRAAPAGDWLLVHMRPECTSVAVVRGQDVISFRTRAEDGEESLADTVHQTTMYYQDRLSGRGFTRVLLGGTGRGPAAVTAVRHSLERRLGVAVEPIEAARWVTAGERGLPQGEAAAAVAPVLGMLLRARSEAVTV